jgi:hypothetical protein
VIASFDDDLDSARDFDEPEPGPSWFDCPMLPCRDMLAVIERRKDLDRRAVNLFRNALEGKPRSDLLDQYLGPHLYLPGSHYIYTTPDPSRITHKELASGDYGAGYRTPLGRALRSVLEHPVVDR